MYQALLRRLAGSFAFFCLPVLAHAWAPEIGTQPNEITTFEYADGSALSLEALRGSPVLLYFGADWCPPCHKARPTVEKVAKTYQAKGLRVIFLSNDDNRFRPNKLEEEKRLGLRIAMPTLTDCPPGNCPGGVRDLGKFGRTYVLPTAILLDGNGVVRAKLERGQRIINGLESAVDQLMVK